jgi:hypothetical protein
LRVVTAGRSLMTAFMGILRSPNYTLAPTPKALRQRHATACPDHRDVPPRRRAPACHPSERADRHEAAASGASRRRAARPGTPTTAARCRAASRPRRAARRAEDEEAQQATSRARKRTQAIGYAAITPEGRGPKGRCGTPRRRARERREREASTRRAASPRPAAASGARAQCAARRRSVIAVMASAKSA